MLADTSVWIDHFRRGNSRLARALEHDALVIHEFVIGELACGNLRDRGEILELLLALPRLETVPHDEVLEFLRLRDLAGKGLGWIDVHLLAACEAVGTSLFTFDARLASAARSLGNHA